MSLKDIKTIKAQKEVFSFQGAIRPKRGTEATLFRQYSVVRNYRSLVRAVIRAPVLLITSFCFYQKSIEYTETQYAINAIALLFIHYRMFFCLGQAIKMLSP